VTSNPGCILQIQAAAAQAGKGLKVVHLVQLLDDAIGTARDASHDIRKSRD
jgi:Fe-S oxidoreductase